MPDLTKLTRRELYDLVWSTPMSQLAPRFGLSDHGLANICERHRVPTPPRGFWAKKEAGKKVKQTIFVKTDDPRLENIELCESDPLPDDVREIVERARPVVLVPVPKPEADTGAVLPLGQIHMALRNTATALRRDKSQDGVARAFGPGLCGVEVSKPSVERAIRLLDGLVKGLEQAGMRVAPAERQMIVRHADVDEEFRLTEATRRVPHVLTPAEERRGRGFLEAFGPKYDYVREGVLRVTLNAGYGPAGTVTKWADGARARLEEKVPAIVSDILVYFDVRKLEREKAAIEERRRVELSRRRVLAKKRDERETTRIDFLESLIEREAKARQLSAWLERLNPQFSGQEHARFVAWARERLEALRAGLEPSRVESALQRHKLFPDVSNDELHDPLGDPSSGSIWR